MTTLGQDLRYAARMFRKSPAFTAVVVITLALGIGANTAVFTLLDTLFLRTLPIHEPGRIVNITATESRSGRADRLLSYPEYVYYRDHTVSLTDVAAHYSSAPINLSGRDGSREINGAVVSANYFSMLGVRPALGRFFRPEEDAAPDMHPVAVISNALWHDALARDPSVLGKPILLNGTFFTVVGVAPEGFLGTVPGGLAVEVWLPTSMVRVGYRYCDGFARECTIFRMIGRLAPGRSIETARAEMAGLAARLSTGYPRTNIGRGVSINPARGAVADGSADSRLVPSLLTVAVALLLVIACGNVAALLLARSTTRRDEMAVRLALGASRGRLLRQLLTESLLLSLAGGALGLVVSVWGRDLLGRFYAVTSEGQRAYFQLGLDSRVLLWTLSISILTGILFGIAPALHAMRSNIVPARKGDRDGGATRLGPRDVLVIAQTALSIVLLVGAGLLVRSLRAVERGPGFDPKGVVLLRLRPALVGRAPAQSAAFQREVIHRLEALPGVLAASPAQFAPQWNNMEEVSVPGRTPSAAEAPRAGYNFVGERHFDVLRVPFLRGRDFDGRDTSRSPRVAIVNETLTRSLFPNEDAIGKSLTVGGLPALVVGVVKDAQYRTSGGPRMPFVYLDFWQADAATSMDSRTHVRVTGDPAKMLGIIRREIAKIDPNVPISEERSLSEWLRYSFRPVLAATLMLNVFGALALFLSATGLYGVLAFAVTRRRREIAIRMALGAPARAVARTVIGRGARFALLGIVAGLCLAAWGARFVSSLLYEVGGHDLATFVGAPLLLFAVAMLASYLPARRAMRVDPMQTLRGD